MIYQIFNNISRTNSKIPMTKEELAEFYWDGDKAKIEKYGYKESHLLGHPNHYSNLNVDCY